jgi:hypothetical protein
MFHSKASPKKRLYRENRNRTVKKPFSFSFVLL